MVTNVDLRIYFLYLSLPFGEIFRLVFPCSYLLIYCYHSFLVSLVLI